MMACEYICDGCGKREKAAQYSAGHGKPPHWYQRGDEQGTQDACSRECVEKISEVTKKTGIILPL